MKESLLSGSVLLNVSVIVAVVCVFYFWRCIMQSWLAASEEHQAPVFSPWVAMCVCVLPAVRGVCDLLPSSAGSKIQHRSSICTQTHTFPLPTILLHVLKLWNWGCKIRLSVMLCVSEIWTHPVYKTLPVSSYMKEILHHIHPDIQPSLLYSRMFTLCYSSASEFRSVLLLSQLKLLKFFE